MQFMFRGETATLTRDGIVEASSFAEAVEKARQVRPDLNPHVVEGAAADCPDTFAVFKLEAVNGNPNRMSPKYAGTALALSAHKH